MPDEIHLFDSYEAARIDLKEVVYTKGQRRGRCPQCSPTRKPEHQREKDLSINFDDGTFNCHHCGWYGRLKDGNGIPNVRTKREYKAPRPITPNVGTSIPDQELFHDYFKDRGISTNTLDAFHVKLQRLKAPQDQQVHLVASFPYYALDGSHLNTKHRAIDTPEGAPKLYWFESGAEQIWYNLNQLNPEEPLIIVEGEIDALSCFESGARNVVSVPGGAPDTEDQHFVSKFHFFERDLEYIKTFPGYVLATDADNPGRILETELARRLTPIKCKRVDWTTVGDPKDANDLLLYYGPEGLLARLEMAKVMPVVGLYTGDDLLADILLAYDEGWDRGALSGFDNLDQILRLARGYISIWTGHSGSGKSTALDNVLVGLASTSQWATAFYSPEQMPLSRHQANLIQIKAGKPFNRVDKYGNINEDRISKADLSFTNWWLSEYFSYIMPQDKRDLQSILDHVRQEIQRKGIVCFVLDPWNCIADEKPSHMAQTDWINKALYDIKLFAQETNTHGCIVAHPTKQQNRRPGQKETRPTLTDISGSINFRNQADYGVVVHRDQGSINNGNLVSISAAKIRMEETGQMGASAWFNYDHRTARLSPYLGLPPLDDEE